MWVPDNSLKISILTNTLRSKTDRVKNLIGTTSFKVNEIINDYNETLLHVAVRMKNYDLASYLINEDIDASVSNRFSETALDLCMQNRDKRMAGILLTQDCQIQLNKKIKSLEAEKAVLTTNSDELYKQVEELKRTNKRKHEDYEVCDRENKRLKTEVNQLTKDHSILTQTVKSLRNSMKKK